MKIVCLFLHNALNGSIFPATGCQKLYGIVGARNGEESGELPVSKHEYLGKLEM